MPVDGAPVRFGAEAFVARLAPAATWGVGAARGVLATAGAGFEGLDTVAGEGTATAGAAGVCALLVALAAPPVALEPPPPLVVLVTIERAGIARPAAAGGLTDVPPAPSSTAFAPVLI